VLVAVALTGGSAAAKDIEWCAEDPSFSLLGAHFRLTAQIGTPASAVTRIAYVVEVPVNAGDVAVSFPADDSLASITTVTVQRTGDAYTGDGSFRVRVGLTVNASEHAKVVVLLDGRSVDSDDFKGHTNKPLKFRFAVVP
jgi:hypothetical protein